MTPPRRYTRPDTGKPIERFVPATLWAPSQIQRLLDDLAEAPLIPEAFIDRYTRSQAYSPWRAKNSRQAKKLLTDMQHDVLLALSQGKNFDEMRHEGISADPRQIAFQAKTRLGCLTHHQAIAVAIDNGIIPAPEPTFPPGRNFQVGMAVHRDKTLTKREKQVLQRIANGMTAPQMADDLELSTETVKDSIKALRSKYSAVNIAHLAALAVRLGHIG